MTTLTTALIASIRALIDLDIPADQKLTSIGVLLDTTEEMGGAA